MRSILYKKFVNILTVDIKTIIDYAFSIYKNIESKTIVINEKHNSICLENVDKAYLALFLSLLTVNTTVKEHFYNNNINRDTFLEFLESYNDKLILPLDMQIISEEEKEKIYSEAFLFLEKLKKENVLLTPEKIAAFLFKHNEMSNILDLFFKEMYNDVNNAMEHKSSIGLIEENEELPCLELITQNSNEEKKSIPNNLPKSEITKKIPSILEEYGTNINEKKTLHTAINRNQEIRNIQISLKTPSKKSVILVGDTGVGKRTIVESLAKDIKNGNVPQGLKDKQIIEIDVANILAGTSYRGQFEERVKEILEKAKENDNIILFINNIHKGINMTEEENRIDFVSMLSNYLARGELSIIATTTKESYDNIILPNNISNKLWKISVEEPSIETVEEILDSCIDEIVEITKINFPNSERKKIMIKSIAEITSKEKRGFFSSGNNPDLAKGILERTFAIASINNHNTVNELDLIEAIETDESISREARERQINIIKQTFSQLSKNKSNNIIKLQLVKKQ